MTSSPSALIAYWVCQVASLQVSLLTSVMLRVFVLIDVINDEWCFWLFRFDVVSMLLMMKVLWHVVFKITLCLMKLSLAANSPMDVIGDMLSSQCPNRRSWWSLTSLSKFVWQTRIQMMLQLLQLAKRTDFYKCWATFVWSICLLVLAKCHCTMIAIHCKLKMQLFVWCCWNWCVPWFGCCLLSYS